MEVNTNGTVTVDKVVKTHKENMDLFDSLSPRLRRLIREAPFALNANPERLKEQGEEEFYRRAVAELPRILKESCAATYGPEHPQA